MIFDLHYLGGWNLHKIFVTKFGLLENKCRPTACWIFYLFENVWQGVNLPPPPTEIGIKARPQGRFYENLICIVLFIGSELDMNKSYHAWKYIYWTDFYLKISDQGWRLAPKQTARKIPKIVQNDKKPRFRATRLTKIKGLMFITFPW